MIVVLDCNIWITLVINRNIDFIVKLAESGIELASCPTLKDEITDVLDRPKLKKFVPPDSVAKVARLHDLITKTYKISTIPEVITDEKDNYLFALCAKSKADYLVSGDKLGLAVGAYKKTKIIQLNAFRGVVNVV